MNIWIVYREDGYGAYTVRKVFSSYNSAQKFVDEADPWERALLSIEEDHVED